ASAWQRCAEAVRSGRSGFELAHKRKMFDFLDGDERLRHLFQRSLQGSEGWNRAIVDVLELAGKKVLVDVGAGDGRLLQALLARWPALSGVAFDRPAVVESSSSSSSSLGARIEWVAGDFFREVPPGDVHLLRWVLHDWPDDDAVKILERVRAA